MDSTFVKRPANSFLFVTLANFAFFCGVTSFFTLPVHLQQMGADRAEIGRVMGAFGLASLFAIPITGSLVDRYGRRPFMVIGGLCWSLTALGFAGVESIGPALYALRLLHGLAFSLTFVATNALIVELARPGELGRAIAVFGTTTLAAHAVGPSVGEWVAGRFGFEMLFVVAAVIGLLSVALFAKVPDPARAEQNGSAAEGIAELVRRPGARGNLIAALAAALAFGSAIHFVPVFVRHRGIGGHAPFFVGYVVSAVTVRLLLGGLGDRMGNRRLAIGAALAFSLSVMALSVTHGAVMLTAVALVYGAAHGLSYPAMNAAFVEQAPAGARGRAMALFNLSFNVGMTLSAVAAGELAERFGYGLMYLVMGFAGSLGAAVMLVDRERSGLTTRS